jgi:hypothetical protein
MGDRPPGTPKPAGVSRDSWTTACAGTVAAWTHDGPRMGLGTVAGPRQHRRRVRWFGPPRPVPPPIHSIRPTFAPLIRRGGTHARGQSAVAHGKTYTRCSESKQALSPIASLTRVAGRSHRSASSTRAYRLKRQTLQCASLCSRHSRSCYQRRRWWWWAKWLVTSPNRRRRNPEHAPLLLSVYGMPEDRTARATAPCGSGPERSIAVSTLSR